MKKVLITLVFSLFSVVSFTCICASNNLDNMHSCNVSKETVVYITPSGKCYHYKQSCAGKNAIKTTLDKCKGKRPCKKCVR